MFVLTQHLSGVVGQRELLLTLVGLGARVRLVVTGTVAGCPQVWKNSARPTTTWPANRYFMAYDNLAHAYWDAMTVDFLNFVNSLAWSPTPW